jgi:hypothetical protein
VKSTRPVNDEARLQMSKGARVSRSKTALVILMLGGCTSFVGCGGSTRSAAAVCNVWDTQGLALHERYEAVDQAEKTSGANGVLSVLTSAIGAPNELARLMTQLADVAPPESQPDFEAVASAFKKLSESEGKAITDPLGAIADDLVESAATSGSYERVDSFLAKNCGIPRS